MSTIEAAEILHTLTGICFTLLMRKPRLITDEWIDRKKLSVRG